MADSIIRPAWANYDSGWGEDDDKQLDLNAFGETVEHVAVGPPGCGKTTWLGRQAKHAAEKYGPEGVIIGSLTRAAAAEVAIKGEAGVPERNIATLHAHAYRALERPKLLETAAGLGAWNEWVGVSSYRISNKHAADPENASPDPAGIDNEGAELMQAMNVYRARMLDQRLWRPDVLAFSKKWHQFMDEHGYVDFTGLIERALEELDELPSKPAVIMLDEAQDMSRLEMAFARKMAGADSCAQLVIVGDPDQALYTWRGADPEAVFGRDVDSVITLSQSYRVPEAVREVAQAWIEKIPGRLPVQYDPRRDATGNVVRGKTETRTLMLGYPEQIIAAVNKDLDQGKSVMVLATCGYMLNPLLAKLRATGQPFHNPYRAAFNAWNPLNGSRRLLAFLRPKPGVWPEEEARLWTWDDLRRWTEPLRASETMTRGSKALIEAKCRQGRMGPEDTQANDVVAVDTVLSLFLDDDATREAVWSQDLDWWESKLRANDYKAAQFSLAVARRHGGARLLERPRLVTGTIHSVKGGQADVVYLFPDLSTAGYWGGWKLTPDTEAHKSIVRQFYVGMTRAREKLVLCHASNEGAVSW